MEYMDLLPVPSATNNQFNWDDIDVGNHVLDHSQDFFENKHSKHERPNEQPAGEEMDLLKEIDAITFDDTINNKENKTEVGTPTRSTVKAPLTEIHLHQTPNNGSNKPKVKDNICKEYIPPKQTETPQSEARPITVTEKPVNFSDSIIARNRARINPGVAKKVRDSPAKSSSDEACQSPPAGSAIVLSESQLIRHRARINPGVKKEKYVAQAPTVSETKSEPVPLPPPAPSTPHAYHCGELYKRRKEELLNKRLDEERKMRQFHSRPVPNFSACHKSLQQKKIIHAVTTPITPVVLKKSLEMGEKRKQKLEELKKMHPPKFVPRPPTVVYEEPFVPKRTHGISVPCPFNLHSERRLQERKQYDATMQRVMEEKQKQDEEERKKREEVRIKELRKLTTFKARPNPFK